MMIKHFVIVISCFCLISFKNKYSIQIHSDKVDLLIMNITYLLQKRSKIRDDSPFGVGIKIVSSWNKIGCDN